jgi:hypothetical protein
MYGSYYFIRLSLVTSLDRLLQVSSRITGIYTAAGKVWQNQKPPEDPIVNPHLHAHFAQCTGLMAAPTGLTVYVASGHKTGGVS